MKRHGGELSADVLPALVVANSISQVRNQLHTSSQTREPQALALVGAHRGDAKQRFARQRRQLRIEKAAVGDRNDFGGEGEYVVAHLRVQHPQAIMVVMRRRRFRLSRAKPAECGQIHVSVRAVEDAAVEEVANNCPKETFGFGQRLAAAHTRKQTLQESAKHSNDSDHEVGNVHRREHVKSPEQEVGVGFAERSDAWHEAFEDDVEEHGEERERANELEPSRATNFGKSGQLGQQGVQHIGKAGFEVLDVIRRMLSSTLRMGARLKSIDRKNVDISRVMIER